MNEAERTVFVYVVNDFAHIVHGKAGYQGYDFHRKAVEKESANLMLALAMCESIPADSDGEEAAAKIADIIVYLLCMARDYEVDVVAALLERVEA